MGTGNFWSIFQSLYTHSLVGRRCLTHTIWVSRQVCMLSYLCSCIGSIGTSLIASLVQPPTGCQATFIKCSHSITENHTKKTLYSCLSFHTPRLRTRPHSRERVGCRCRRPVSFFLYSIFRLLFTLDLIRA